MLKTIPQYLSAMSDTYGLTKTIGVIDICTKSNGSPDFRVGNNSIIFHIRHHGVEKMLKCYTRKKQNLRRIYGEKCLREELYIHSDSLHGEWVDVILDDWIEGETLQNVIIKNRGNPATIKSLAEKFDSLAVALLAENWAHGDLKPENIIVTPSGELHLIDFDAVFLPEFTGERSEEIGTASFQHPMRDTEYFDKSIDDYPIALISTALHALALDPSLAERHEIEERLLFHPNELIKGCQALEEVIELFAINGDVLHYHIARLLKSLTPRLFRLKEFLTYATRREGYQAGHSTEIPEIDYDKGLCGYRLGEKFVIPPLYNNGFDFSEGLAAVCIGRHWHYIDLQGNIVLRCPQYEAVKPFHNGVAVVVENGTRKFINRKGEII